MKYHKRGVYGVIGFLILVFLGVIYAWSIFIQPLEQEFGWLRSQTSSIFSISMVFFCVGNLAAGVIMPRFGPRVGIFLAAATIGIGFMASSFTFALPMIFISYGVLCGFAVGLGANIVLTVSLSWFANQPGIASGALLMGFGFGSMVLGSIVTWMLSFLNWRMTFRVLAVIFFILLCIGAVLLVNPPESETKKASGKEGAGGAKDYTTKEMLGSAVFKIGFLWLVLLSSGGLALIGNAVPAAMDVLAGQMGEAEARIAATSAMGMISLFNGCGRFGSGMIWDKKGLIATLLSVTSVYIAAMVLLAYATHSRSFPLLVAGFIVLGTGYGGTISFGSAMTRGLFGQTHYSMNYACMTCNMIFAALIGPPLSGYLRTSTGTYLYSYLVFMGMGAIGLVLAALMKKQRA